MTPLQACELPQEALLAKYRHEGAYTDCYAMEVAGPVSHAEYVEAFYTTPLFKAERRLLAWFVSRPSTDLQARELARGTRDLFSAWSVEGRRDDQLLMCDFAGSTRSWLMTVPGGSGEAQSTRLYFGSAVVPVVHARSGQAKLGFVFHALLGFHRLYSRILLRSAGLRLVRSRPVGR